MNVTDMDPRTITAPVTVRARYWVNGWVTGENLYGGDEHTFAPRVDSGAENVRVIDVTDSRGKWQGVFVLATTGDCVDAVFARAADKLRKKDVAALVEDTAALIGKACRPAHEAWRVLHRERKAGRL